METLDLPIYILIDESAKVLSSAKTEILRPSELPDTGNYYLVTQDGLFIVKDSPLIQGGVPLVDTDDNLVRSLHTFPRTRRIFPQVQRQWKPTSKPGMFDRFFDWVDGFLD